MIQKYIAEDGTQFDTYLECKVYETQPENGGIQMFSEDGMMTVDITEAALIILPNVKNASGDYVLAAHWFIQQCEEAGITSDGITELSHGFYHLVDDTENYKEVDPALIDILRKTHTAI